MSTWLKEGVRTWIGAETKTGRRILERLMPRRHREPDMPWKIINLTRQAVLAERVEVADRGAKRRKGLLGRNGLGPGKGLWIVPCESIHTFFMRFPIDLVYVDRKLRVRKVRSGVPPWRLSACLSAHSVVELASGTVRETRTVAGDLLEFSPLGSPDQNSETISSSQSHSLSET